MDITDGKPAPYITWSTRQVISWLQGLDDVLEPCLPELEAKGVNGKWLNSVTPGELCKLGVTKVGHQMIIMDKIRQLQAQYAAFDNETMQIVLFRVSRCCVRITAAVNALMSITERQDSRDPDSDSVYPGILDDIQDAVAYVLNSVLALMLAVMNAGFWLERPPFLLLPDMNVFRQLIIEGTLVANRQAQLAISTQVIGHFKDMLVFVESIRVRVEEVIQNFSDSIMLTPCGMELVQIRKVDNAEFGFNFRSTLNNVHVIISVQNDSPAFCSGKVSKGDEVIEVNDQVVIGWQHRRVADLMRIHPKRITLRLRKRPAHTTDFPGFLGGGRRHRVVTPQNPTAGTLPQFTRAGNLFARTPKRRTPLQPPNEASMMNGTSESTESALALSPTTNSIPEAPIYSPSSSSSSSRCASMKLNDLQNADPGLLDPSDSATQNVTFSSHSFPAIRMISSTPSTPLMAVRTKHREPSGERVINLSNSQGPASPVETSGLKIVYEPNSLRFASVSSTPSKSVLPRFHGTHRRTASGDPTLLMFSNPVAKEQDLDSSKASVSPNASKVQALDKRCRFIRGSMEDLARLGKFVFGSKRSARRISCKELGKGDWQGWLWLKKSNPLASKYVKRWCVFKNSTLYYYRNLEDDCAEGVINVRGFTITPGPTELKSGRFPFYVVNEWVRFVFASESELDRSKWMNVLGLASIGLTTELHHARIGGFHPGYVTTELATPVEDPSNTDVTEDGSMLSPKYVVSPTLSSEERFRKKRSETSESWSLSKHRRHRYFPWSGGKQTAHSPPPVDECEPNIRSASLPMSQLSSSHASPLSSTRSIFSTRRSPSVPIVIDYSESEDDADEDACHSRSESRNASQLSSSYESKPLRTDSKFSLPLLLPVTRSGSTSPKGKIQILWPKTASQSRPNTGSPKSGAQLLAPVHDLRRRSQSPSPQSDLGMRAAQLVCHSKVPHPPT